MGQATFMALRWHVQNRRATLRTCKGFQVILWSFFFNFFFPKCSVRGWAPKLIPPASTSWEYGKQSPFIRARNLIQPQGKKLSHDKVHGAWNMVWRKGPFTTTSVQHTCGRNYLRKRRDQRPPLPSSGEMWTIITPPPKSPTELL